MDQDFVKHIGMTTPNNPFMAGMHWAVAIVMVYEGD